MKKAPIGARAKIGSRGTAGSTAPTTGPSLGVTGSSKPVVGSKKMTVSQQLEAENKKMETKLETVKKLMEMESQKRSSQGMKGASNTGASAQAPVWRSSAAAQQDGLRNHGDNVVNRLNQQKPEPAQLQQPPPVQQNINALAMNNLNAALAKQNPLQEEKKEGGSGAQEEFQEVHDFLDSMSLLKYQARFVENGIEDEETILELNDSHLDSMKVPLGHKLKMLKKIKQVRQDKGMTVPEQRQDGVRPTSQMSQITAASGILNDDPADNVQTSVKAFSQADLSELPYTLIVTPEETKQTAVKQSTSGTQANDTPQPQRSALKKSYPVVEGASTAMGTDSSNLTTGEFNEDESHKSFLEALNAWRDPEPKSTAKKQPDMSSARKSVSFQNGNAAAAERHFSQKKTMLPIDKSENVVKNSDAGNLGKKISCWQCYKLFYGADGAQCEQAKDKTFCSKLCLAKFEADYVILCQVVADSKCSGRFVKNDGVFEKGKWFCSQECCLKDKDILKIQKMAEDAEKLRKEEEDMLNESPDSDFEI